MKKNYTCINRAIRNHLKLKISPTCFIIPGHIWSPHKTKRMIPYSLNIDHRVQYLAYPDIQISLLHSSVIWFKWGQKKLMISFLGTSTFCQLKNFCCLDLPISLHYWMEGWITQIFNSKSEIELFSLSMKFKTKFHLQHFLKSWKTENIFFLPWPSHFKNNLPSSSLSSESLPWKEIKIET